MKKTSNKLQTVEEFRITFVCHLFACVFENAMLEPRLLGDMSASGHETALPFFRKSGSLSAILCHFLQPPLCTYLDDCSCDGNFHRTGAEVAQWRFRVTSCYI